MHVHLMMIARFFLFPVCLVSSLSNKKYLQRATRSLEALIGKKIVRVDFDIIMHVKEWCMIVKSFMFSMCQIPRFEIKVLGRGPE